MHTPLRIAAVVAGLCFAGLPGTPARADHAERLNELLAEGKLVEAEAEFADAVRRGGRDHQARAALGVVRFMRAVEGLAQEQYRYGLLAHRGGILPIARMPVPANPDPEPISYEDVRKLIAGFARGLQQAEQALAEVDTSDVKLPLFLGCVRLDIDSDGEATEEESLWRMFATINPGVQPDQGENFCLALDGADVHWLRGYCHFLMAFCDFGLAYDGRELFERCGHLLYPDVETPYEFLKRPTAAAAFTRWDIADLIAAVHLVNFPLKEADRMRSAHEHLLAMVQQSRASWKRALAETDDDREWIPNPDQQGVLRIRVSREMIDGWHEVLGEFEALLNGERLVPFWRTLTWNRRGEPAAPNAGIGFNLKQFFTQPRDFDLVLLVTGTGAAPYLEEGRLSTPQAWSRMTRVFGGEFFGFALWFN